MMNFKNIRIYEPMILNLFKKVPYKMYKHFNDYYKNVVQYHIM